MLQIHLKKDQSSTMCSKNKMFHPIDSMNWDDILPANNGKLPN